MKFKLFILFFALFFQSVLAYSAIKLQLSCKHIHPIQQAYLSHHINFSTVGKELENRVVEQFIKNLDSSHIYLTQSDVSQIKKKFLKTTNGKSKGIFSSLKVADCSSIKEAHQILSQRIKDRVDFVQKIIKRKNFKFNKKISLILDSKERDFSKTRKESRKFHKKYLHFQIANYMATDMKEKEAIAHIFRSYGRLKRRTNEFKQTDLWALYLNSFAHSLDPHSSYLSQDALEDFEIAMRLSLDGIGATLRFKDGFTIIEQLIPGGAAYRSNKIHRGDKIVAVGQGISGKLENVIEMDLRDVVRRIRGKKGTKVRLSILRKKEKKTKRFVVTIVRAKIRLEDEAASIEYINQNGSLIGILNLPSFYSDSSRNGRSSARDMKVLLKQAKARGISGLVLDLSQNGGGSLNDAVKITGLFFKTGNVVKQSTKNQRNLVLADRDKEVDYAGPLVVLTSKASASASEIVAGALQDYKRAVIIGDKSTFGKGSVQSVEPLPLGLGALKTTVGLFFTAGGFSTQKRGVRSDVVIPSSFDESDIGEGALDYSLSPKKLQTFTSAEAYVESGSGAWNQIKSKTIKRLKKLSSKRVSKNKEFKKLIAERKKSKSKGKRIYVREILSEGSDEEKKKDKDKDVRGIISKEKKRAAYLKRIDLKEAVQVLFDLIKDRKGSRLLGKKLSS